MAGLLEYIVFTLISVLVMGASAIASDRIDDYNHEILRGVLTAVAVISVCATVAGVIAIFAVITNGVVNS